MRFVLDYLLTFPHGFSA